MKPHQHIEYWEERGKHGRTGYTFRRLVSDALDNILSNSALPLQIVSCMGFVSSLLSLALSFYYLYKYFLSGFLFRVGLL